MKKRLAILSIGISVFSVLHTARPVEAGDYTPNSITNKPFRLQLYPSSISPEPAEKKTILLEVKPSNFLPAQDKMYFDSEVLASQKEGRDFFFWQRKPFGTKRVSVGWFVESIYPVTRSGPRTDAWGTGIALMVWSR